MSSNGQPSDRVSLYIIDQNRLQLGDILLTRVPLDLKDRATWTSQVIQNRTDSRFSHAALYIRYGLFIEAISTGVCRLAIMATGARDKGNIEVLRLNEAVVPDAVERAKAAAQRGELFLSRGYSKRGAAGVVLPILRDPDRHALFCSQLVALAYRDLEFQLVPGKPPEATSPGDLHASGRLRPVTDEVVRLLRTDQHPPYYLDEGSFFERPHHFEVKTKLEVLGSKLVKRSLSRLRELPPSFIELEHVLAKHKDSTLDAAILGELKRHRFAEEFFGRVQRFTSPAEIDEAAQHSVRRAEDGSMSKEELHDLIVHGASLHQQLSEDVADRRRDYDGYQRGLSSYGLTTFGYLAMLQRRLLALSVECLNAKTRELNALEPIARQRGVTP
jgi:hypothetical protein